MTEKATVESCVGAWLHNKRLEGEPVTALDEALIERLHRELGTTHFRPMVEESRSLERVR